MFQKNNFFLIPLFLITFSLLFSCNNKDKNIPDVSSVKVDLKINRFEQDFFAIDTNNIVAGIENIEKKYPDFSDFYFQQVLQIKKPWDTTGVYRQHVKGFLTFPFVRELHHKVDSTFQDFSKIEKDLQQGLQFYKYYFPEKEIPEFNTFVSEFTYSIALPPRGYSVAIGLDFFLGKDFKYYYFEPLNLPKYVARTQDKEHLAAKIFAGLVEDMVGSAKGNRFLDHIIHNGKKTYILDQLLPYSPDSIKLGYTAKQVQWCNNSESAIWDYFLQEKMIFSDKFQDFKSLITLAPNSAGMPEEAPGQVGNWMGWQIVKAYMRKNPETTLQELIDLKNVQEILTKSKYRPRR